MTTDERRPDILDALPDLVTEAGRIETERRRRNR